MGVKATLRNSSNVPHDTSDFTVGEHDGAATTPGSKAGQTTSSSRGLDQQPPQRRKFDSVLDDIMGDPDDFKDLADSDAKAMEADGKIHLEHEEAGVGAVHPVTRSPEDGQVKTSGEAVVTETNGMAGDHNGQSSPSSKSAEDLGSLEEQKGKGSQQKAKENEGGSKLSSNVLVVGSGSKEHKVCTRYFIIKSLNHHNIAKSIEKGIWATQAMNEPVLNEAFENSERVLLVFSVNMSGHFQGYAQMTSPIGRRRANVWSEATEGANPWGGTFSVDWLRLHDLPFQKTVHLKNPLNFFKPVKISRDCQELAQEVGDALCALIDEGADNDGKPRRKVVTSDLAALPLKRKRRESVSIGGSQMRHQQNVGPNGVGFPAVYSPNFPQGVVPDSFSSPGLIRRPPGGFSNQSFHPVDRRRVSKSKSPHTFPTDRSLDKERDSERENRHRVREESLERPRDRTRSSSSGHSADLPVEDDLLNMTYEEYLQRHGHSREFKTSSQQGGGPYLYNSSRPGYGGSWRGRNAGMGSLDNQYSNYISNWYTKQGPRGRDGFFGTNGMGHTYPVTHQPEAHWVVGHTDDLREWHVTRPVDRISGPGYLDHYRRASRCMERITEAGS